MKKMSIKAGILAMALTTTLACGEKNSKQKAKENNTTRVEQAEQETEDRADVSFSDEMTGKVFQDYQQLRTALVASDADGTQTAARNLAENFTEEREEMKSMVLAMAETDQLEEQRELFSGVTAKVEPMFKDAIAEGTIYKQFCPMAFEGKGGYWISDVNEIRNPYYGDRMLKCGEVVEEIQ